jgi:hypothetical protein
VVVSVASLYTINRTRTIPSGNAIAGAALFRWIKCSLIAVALARNAELCGLAIASFLVSSSSDLFLPSSYRQSHKEVAYPAVWSASASPSLLLRSGISTETCAGVIRHEVAPPPYCAETVADHMRDTEEKNNGKESKRLSDCEPT